MIIWQQLEKDTFYLLKRHRQFHTGIKEKDNKKKKEIECSKLFLPTSPKSKLYNENKQTFTFRLVKFPLKILVTNK